MHSSQALGEFAHGVKRADEAMAAGLVGLPDEAEAALRWVLALLARPPKRRVQARTRR